MDEGIARVPSCFCGVPALRRLLQSMETGEVVFPHNGHSVSNHRLPHGTVVLPHNGHLVSSHRGGASAQLAFGAQPLCEQRWSGSLNLNNTLLYSMHFQDLLAGLKLRALLSCACVVRAPWPKFPSTFGYLHSFVATQPKPMLAAVQPIVTDLDDDLAGGTAPQNPNEQQGTMFKQYQ